jgi:hypothetical protein
LGQAYNYKSISDYEVGPLAQVYLEDALDVLEKAAAFVAGITDRIATRLPSQGAP